jgi:caspase domain-containing protein
MDESGERRALIVASDTYEDPKLRMLRAPAHDAQALGRVLGDPVIGNFSATILENEPEYRLRRAIGRFFGKGGRKDVLLLHFACHGVKDEDGTLYFAATDTETDNLQATALPADFVNDEMNRSRSRRIVLLLDCCYSGAFARGMSHRADQGVQLKERFEGSGRVVLTASNSMEYAWEGNDLLGGGTPSVFTSALVQGLEAGEADLDRDGQVSVDELYDYVFERVRRETPSQTPGKWSFDVAGDFYIARTRQGAVAVPIPDYLRDLISSPLPSARLSAVEALRLLLLGSHVGLALGARMALEQLVEDDSRAVSKAAANALASAPETLNQAREAQERETTVAAERTGKEEAEREASLAIEQAEREAKEREAKEREAKEREAKEREAKEREAKEGERLPSRASRVTLATMAFVGSSLIFVGTLSPESDHLEFPQGFAKTPLLFPDHVAAFVVALVCGVLLLAGLRRQTLRIAGVLAGVGLQQVGAQLGIFLGLTAHAGNDPEFGWGAFTSLIGAGILLSASTLSFYRLRTLGPPPGGTPRFGRGAQAAAGLGAVLFVMAEFSHDDVNAELTAGFTIPLAVATITAAVFVFRPYRDQASRVFVGSAMLSFAALLALGYVFFASSVSHYVGEIVGATSIGFRAVSGSLLLGAAVIAYGAGRREAHGAQRG